GIVIICSSICLFMTLHMFCSTLFPYTTLFRSVLDKVEGTPEHVLIYNEDIRGKKIGELDNIDYEWYIAEAQHRINDFLGIKPEKDRKSTRLNSSHVSISYAVFCLKKKNIVSKT